MDTSKRKAMQDVLAAMSRAKRAVASDSSSEADAPDPSRALVTKLLLDRFNATIKPTGVNLVHAQLGWNPAVPPAVVFAKLQQLGLLDKPKRVKSLPPANLPLVQ
jgi:hypothetical protein